MAKLVNHYEQYLTSACDDDVEDLAGEALVEWDDLKSQICTVSYYTVIFSLVR